MRGTVLGLDMGVASLGWALIEAEFDDDGRQTQEYRIVDCGVRIFESGMDLSKGPVSRNVKRRQARAVRRIHQRRRRRKQRIRRELTAAGLLPESPAQFEDVLGLDPYELRRKGLDKALTPHELGRAILHLGQRRGFKSNRKSARDAEHGKLLQQISGLQREMVESESRTLGEHLANLRDLNRDGLVSGTFRLRKRHTARAMYEHEFESLWNVQSFFDPGRLTEDTRDRIRRALFDQRDFEVTPERRAAVLEAAKQARRARGLPEDRGSKRANLWRAPEVGDCELIPGEPRCPKLDWVAQRFRILKEVNNLRILPRDGAPERFLEAGQRELLIQLLSTHKELTFDSIRTKLKLGEDRFNLEIGGRSKVGGNTVEAAIASAFSKKAWLAKTQTKRDELRELVLGEADEFKLIRTLVEREGLSEEKATKLASLQTGGGVVHLSRKAMAAMIPYLESGATEFAAMEACGFVRQDEAEVCAKLPPTPDLPNPLVRRALVETRKVVNALLREYGRPTRIVVEMGRDLTLLGRKRVETQKIIHENERARDEARDHIAELIGVEAASRSDTTRYLLWREQNGVCPYSGRVIDQQRLFSSDFEVDHIIPRWRSMDDSYSNKVLVLASANREKGDRTPFEWLRDHPQRFAEMLVHVADSQMGYRKKERFRVEEIDEGLVPSRLLNDTRYMAKEAIKYLNQLYPASQRVGEKSVGSSKGILTAKLRRLWGIDGLFGTPDTGGKARDDHRHHAVDAIAIALSTRSRIKRLSDHWRREHAAGRGFHPDAPVFDVPWDGFRQSVAEAMEGIRVSHRVQRKLGGALHEETFYGSTSAPDEYVYTVPLDRLTPPQIDRIRDPESRRLVQARLAECGWKGGKAQPPKGWAEKGVVRPDGTAMHKVRVLKRLRNTVSLGAEGELEAFRHAALGANHHLEVLRKEGVEGPKGLRFEAVSTFEAARRVRRLGLSPIQLDHGDGWKTEMVLYPGDSVLIGPGEGRLCVIQNISTVPKLYVVIRDALDARRKDDVAKSPASRPQSAGSWVKLGLRKVTVDPIGRLSPLHPLA